MSNLTINANSIYDRVIRIGRQTENLVSSITFNVNMWIEEYGAGECVLNVKRNGDGSAYPVPMTITDGLTTWTITDTDTAKKGRGEIQLVYRAGDKVKTSHIFTISCGESLVGGEVPEPYEDLLTELNRMTAQVEAAKTSADQSAQTAQTAANTATTKAIEAEQSANTASGFANHASASATSASTSAQAAAQSAQAAGVARTAAESAAISAQAEAEDAEQAKTAAEQAEANAQASEQTASEKASQAAESAAQAQASADRANVDILRFLPTDSTSGAVASFADGADNLPLKSLTVGIDPVQDTSQGDPSPTNICPISGWTQTRVEQSGVNIFDKATVVQGAYIDDLSGAEKVSTEGVCSDYIPVIPNADYYIKSDQTIGAWGAWYDVDKNYISGITGYITSAQDSAKTKTAPNNARYMRLTITRSGSGNIDTFSVNYPSTDHDYHPYSGQSITIPFGQTVYGGVLDVLSGVLTVDRVKEIFVFDNPTEDSTYNLESQRFNLTKRSTASSNSTGKITNVCGAYAYAQANWNNGKPHFCVGVTSCILYLTKNTYRGGNVELCYPLETPLTYQLTPTEVNSLLGQNNIYADTGDTSVEYRADIQRYIDKRLSQ